MGQLVQLILLSRNDNMLFASVGLELQQLCVSAVNVLINMRSALCPSSGA